MRLATTHREFHAEVKRGIFDFSFERYPSIRKGIPESAIPVPLPSPAATECESGAFPDACLAAPPTLRPALTRGRSFA